MPKLPREPRLLALLSEAPFVRRQLRARGIRGSADLDEVTAQVLAAAAVNLDRFTPQPGANPRAALRAWLKGIARNHANHARERAHVRYEVFDARLLHAAPSEGPSPAAAAATREALERVLARIAKLPAGEKDVVLAVALGETVAEYAQRSGVPLMTAYHRLDRARAKLRRLL